jgi:hypothetical protein
LTPEPVEAATIFSRGRLLTLFVDVHPQVGRLALRFWRSG